MRKTIFLVLGVAIITSVVYGIYFRGQAPAAPPAGKHVLLVTLDTMRADRLGCYGYPRPTSPNLDEFASDSVLFHFAIAQAAVTPVSHASILTGKDPYNHGLRVLHGVRGNELDEGSETLAEVWKKTGGLTAAFISAYTAGPVFGLAQGFDQFEPRYPEEETADYISDRGVVNAPVASQRRAQDTTDKAIGWLRKHTRKGKQLFMWVHYFDPHDSNLLPPDAFMEEHLKTFRRKSPRSEDDKLREIYDAEVLYMDLHIGRLFDELKTQGIWDETVVVVVADHGEGLGDHNWWSHGILYQEQIHVPMIMRVPGVPPRRLRPLVRTIDLAPTILDAAGVDPSVWPAMDGKNLMDAARTGSSADELLAYADSVNLTGYAWPRSSEKRNKKYDKLYCLMDTRHKLIYHQLNPEKTEFYDLQADPGELKNLAASEPDAMKQLVEQLKGMDAFSDIMPVVNDEELERVKRLKSLGYVQ